MESLGVTLQYTAPYSPQENPTERTNRTVKTMIAQYIEGHQSSWDELLPEITLAVNSRVADSTGFTPAYLIETQPEAKEVKMREVFNIVRSNFQRASKDQGRHYNLRRRDWRPTMGSAVLLRQHQLSNAVEGFAAKLAPEFDGPYKVVKFLSPNVVRLTKGGERKRRVANIAQLKPFHHGDEEIDMIPEIETGETGNEERIPLSPAMTTKCLDSIAVEKDRQPKSARITLRYKPGTVENRRLSRASQSSAERPTGHGQAAQRRRRRGRLVSECKSDPRTPTSQGIATDGAEGPSTHRHHRKRSKSRSGQERIERRDESAETRSSEERRLLADMAEFLDGWE
ncbi:hypothetical protein AWZ03_014950, partial [Drosophila navojoa]